MEITGLNAADVIGVHTYCRDDVLELIDAAVSDAHPQARKAGGRSVNENHCHTAPPRPLRPERAVTTDRRLAGLARAFAALGCRAVVLYPGFGRKSAQGGDTRAERENLSHLPAVAFGTQALYKSWQILLDEQADAVHVMGDNSLGVPGLYRFCEKHGIVFYSQLGALKSTSNHAIVRGVMDLLLHRNLTVYRKTPTYAKTPAVAAELESLGVPCRGLMPVGLDTAIIPTIPGSKAMIRRELNINEQVKVLAFVGRLDAYKQPLDLVPLLQAAPDWYAVIIGQGAQSYFSSWPAA